MANGRVRDLALERRWRGIVDRQRRSGLTIRAFCRGEALTATAFGFWKRELRRRDQQTSAAFVELAPVATVVAATAAEVPIELQVGDRRLLLRPGCDLELLGRAVRTLEGLR